MLRPHLASALVATFWGVTHSSLLPADLLETGAASELVSPEHCRGEKVAESYVPLGKCHPTTYPGGWRAAIISQCNSTVYETVVYYNTTICGDGPPLVMPTPVGQCAKVPGQHGVSTLVSCNSTMATMESWTLKPPAPSQLQCKDPSATSSQLLVSAQVDPALVDEVSFEIGLPFHPPFLSVTAQADKSGYVEAPVSGLTTGTRYKISVRSHRVGEQEGNPDVWSNVSQSKVYCKAKAPGKHSMASGQGTGVDVHGVKTRWLEVYRVVGGATAGQPSPVSKVASLPDFLDQHNTGDLIGAMTMLGLYMQKGSKAPFTRYCVELQDVSLPGVITASPDGQSRSAPFANFLSCNQGQCKCMHQADRMIGRLPREQLEEFCDHEPQDWMGNTCECPSDMMNLSEKFVGRSPIPLPFVILSAPNVSNLPAAYPSPYQATPMGSFHSFPGGGRCAPGKQVGEDGCTWQRAPTAWSVYTQDLFRLGYNASPSTMNKTSSGFSFDFHSSLQNVEVAKKAFEALRPPPCGPSSAQAEERLTMWV